MSEAAAIERALARIADGASLREACKGGKLSPWALLRRVDDDPDLAQRYARARELQAHADAAKIDAVIAKLLRVADSGKADTATVLAYRAAADQLRWTAARKHPRVYGERVEVGVTAAITTLTRYDVGPELGAALRSLGERYARGQLATIDATASEVADPTAADPPPPAPVR